MALDPNTNRVDPRLGLNAALAERKWDRYAVGATGVIRSPDRKVFIIDTHCTVQDIVHTVNRWKPLVQPATNDN